MSVLSLKLPEIDTVRGSVWEGTTWEAKGDFPGDITFKLRSALAKSESGQIL